MVCFALPHAPKKKGVYVWDLPTRLFHWALVAAVGVAAVTGFVGGTAMDLHGKAGIAIVGLIAFRIVWGFAGSTYARFASFVRGPAAIRAALRGEWRGVGHNPLGALSVLGLLSLVAFQAGSGLFGNDEISYNGPLYALVSEDVSDTLTVLHIQAVWALGALVLLHLAAVAFYLRVKKDNLVLPMLTGWKDGAPKDAEPARGGGLIAFVVAVCIGIAAAWIAAGGLLPPPPAPAPAGTAPSW